MGNCWQIKKISVYMYLLCNVVVEQNFNGSALEEE